MTVQVRGNGGTVADVGADHRELLTGARPTTVGSYGHFRLAVQTGSIAATARTDEPIFSMRWSSSSVYAVIYRVRITGIIATTAFAVGPIYVKATRATGFSAEDTGGTAITESSVSKLRSTFGTSSAADLRVSSTGVLTAGTRTLDTYDLGQITTHSSGGVGSATPIIGSQYLPHNDLFVARVEAGEHPLVLTANEGLIVRATVPATGVWIAGIEVTWSEGTSY